MPMSWSSRMSESDRVAHVAHELEVVRRHASKLRAAEVEQGRRTIRFARCRRQQRRRVARTADDHARGLLQVELASLRGDVGRGVVESEIWLETVHDLLSDYLAVPVGVEMVDHDPVEPGQLT
jgi:hypothetical protein